MQEKKIILVTGATGAQGGSVARALLESERYAVRIITRNPKSIRALALKNKGAELVVADLEDQSSLERAMEGVYGVFGVTDYWEYFEREYELGKNLINAVKRKDIAHFVFSGLPSYNQISKGAFRVPQYDIKAALEEYSRSLLLPFSFVHLGFYYQNFLDEFAPKLGADGNYYFGFPQGQTKLATVSSEDLGPVVSMIFDHPDEYIGRTVDVVAEDRTCAEYAAMMSRVLGRNIIYQYIPRNIYSALDIFHAEEIADGFEVQRLYIPNHQLGLIESYGLNPAMQSFERWLLRNRKLFDEYFRKSDRRFLAELDYNLY